MKKLIKKIKKGIAVSLLNIAFQIMPNSTFKLKFAEVIVENINDL